MDNQPISIWCLASWFPHVSVEGWLLWRVASKTNCSPGVVYHQILIQNISKCPKKYWSNPQSLVRNRMFIWIFHGYFMDISWIFHSIPRIHGDFHGCPVAHESRSEKKRSILVRRFRRCAGCGGFGSMVTTLARYGVKSVAPRCVKNWCLPSGYVKIAMERSTIFNG